MTTKADAQAHLTKAEEFLAAAEVSVDLNLYNAGCSAAVSAGINAKDAICLVLVGRSAKSENHAKAVAELEVAGQLGRELGSAFGRLLSLKSKSQYQAASVAASDASRALEWAGRMVAAARGIVP